jgi:hypothetical protein
MREIAVLLERQRNQGAAQGGAGSAAPRARGDAQSARRNEMRSRESARPLATHGICSASKLHTHTHTNTHTHHRYFPKHMWAIALLMYIIDILCHSRRKEPPAGNCNQKEQGCWWVGGRVDGLSVCVCVCVHLCVHVCDGGWGGNLKKLKFICMYCIISPCEFRCDAREQISPPRNQTELIREASAVEEWGRLLNPNRIESGWNRELILLSCTFALIMRSFLAAAAGYAAMLRCLLHASKA